MMGPIAWNLTWLRPGVVGGTESYAMRLLDALNASDQAPHLHLFADAATSRRYGDRFAGHELARTPVDNPDVVRRVALERTWLRRQLADLDPTVTHHLGGTVPLARPGSLVTIHDLQPLEDPTNFGVVKRRWLAGAIPAAVERAEVICTPSRWVAERIVDRFSVPQERVVAVPAYATPLRTDPPSQPPGRAVDELLARGPVLLYPAMTLAHKNHRMLFRAFSLAARQRDDIQLVCTGAVGREHDELVDAAAALSPSIHLLGHVPASDLRALMAGAETLLFPSRYEGFGLPVIEAQSVGLPVVSSNAGALPEVAGAGARLLDPDDLDAWADAMATPFSADQRIDLIRRGSENVRRYTAEAMADAQLDAYRVAAG